MQSHTVGTLHVMTALSLVGTVLWHLNFNSQRTAAYCIFGAVIVNNWQMLRPRGSSLVLGMEGRVHITAGERKM